MTNKTRNSEPHAKERGINRLFDTNYFITRQTISRFLPLLLFLAFLVTLYIGNKYYAERTYLEETKLKQEIIDLRAESLTTKAQLINSTKQSDVEAKAKDIGLQQVNTPPKRISSKKE